MSILLAVACSLAVAFSLEATTMDINTSCSSPNHSSRGPHRITMLVIHATAGDLRGALSHLTSAATRVSSHYVIGKRAVVYQLVDDEQAAWHAGVCLWHGETAVNECSIGIELENANTGRDPYPTAQMDAAVELAARQVVRYGIEQSNLVRHLDVAMPRGRKTDPAGFPWPEFVVRVYERAAALRSIPPPSPPQPAIHSYRVAARSNVNVRAAPSAAPAIAIIGSRPPGAMVSGWEVAGAPVAGDANLWVRLEGVAEQYIWLGLLKRI